MGKRLGKRWKKAISMLLTAAVTVTAVPVMDGGIAFAATADDHIALTRQVAAEGMVLMENNGALPLAEGTKVAMFGRAMIDYVRGGGGSGATNVDYQRNILEGMQEKAGEGKVELYQPLVDFYTDQVIAQNHKNDEEITVTDEMMQAAADYASTAIVTIGRYSSEGSDRQAAKGDYYLSDAETELIRRTAESFDQVVVVLNVGAVLDTQWIKDIAGIDSVLMAWQAGMEGGTATADVLVGDVNPSGKFVDTFARSYTDYPSADTFYENGAYVNYKEDIFVGYRFFETFDPDYEKVNYEFGYGLSYTTFQIDNVAVAEDGDDMTVTADVTNTGDVAGKEVVQVYFSAPQGQLGKPAKELAAFAKTSLLAPGESETLTMRYAIDDMSSYDDLGKVQKSAYVLEAGDYEIYVGNSIKDAGNKGSRHTYTVPETRVTEQLTTQAAPVQLTERLLADGTYEKLEVAPEFDPHHVISATKPTIVESESFIDASSAVRAESFYEGLTQKRCLAFFNTKDYFVEYELDVEEAGDYAISMRMANGYAEITNCFSVFVDGQPQPGVVFNAPQTGDGEGKSEWYNFVDCEPFYVKLPQGKTRFRMVANRNNPNYDYMTFTKVDDAPSYCTSVKSEGRTRIEAENFGISGGTNANFVRTEKFTLNGQPAECLAYMNYEGNYVSYWLDVEEAGDYNLYFNAANGRAGFDFDPGIEIDGEAVTVESVHVPQTGDGEGKSEWYVFVDLDPVTVALPAGECVLTLRAPKASYPNLDYLELEKKPAAAKAFKQKRAAASQQAATVQEAADTKLMLEDVYYDPSLMDAFLAQISDRQLIEMLGGQPNTGPANTGGMGNLLEFGIPNAMTADGPQGIRISNHCTAWPVSTLLACTWDVDLVRKVGKAAAVEAHQNGIDIWLAPGMNIHRDPLCGRNFEYYSEDPLLTGKMAAAITEGCQSEGVSITLKHFAANNKEDNRNSSDSRMSERALREIYLKGFEIAVKEAEPWSIMSSYNFINGIETSEHTDLLTNIARGEWGYEGIFMTDWGNNSNHVREMLAGNDVKMPSGDPNGLQKALDDGLITREDIIPCIKRLLNMIMKVNVFQENVLNPTVVEIGFGTKFKAAENIIWSQTVRSEATGDTDGGNSLGYCDAGGWAEYQIDVKDEGFYAVSARSASNAGGGAFDLVVDGKVATSFHAVSTGGWQNWTTLSAQQIYLTGGRHTFRIAFTESGSNLNWLQFDKDESMSEITATPQLMIAKPVVGHKVSEAGVTLMGEDLPYTANIAWMDGEAEETGVFAADVAYTAVVTLQAADGRYFAADTLPSEILIDGKKIALEEGMAAFTDFSRRQAVITYTFDKTEKDSTAILLKIVCNAYADMDVSVYTEESAKALTDALANANTITDQAGVTAAEIEQAISQVMAAAAGLVPDTKNLEEQIQAAKQEADTAKSLANQLAIEAEQNKNAAAEANRLAGLAQAAAEAAQKRAEAAEQNAKKSMLSVIYQAYQDFDLSAYTQESAENLTDAMDRAKTILDQEDATAESIERAAAAILAAATALVSDTDVSGFEAAIDAAKKEAETAKSLVEELQKTVSANQQEAARLIGIAQEAANAANRRAEEAERNAAKATLTIVTNAYTGLDISVYTENSQKAFTDALTAANAIKGQADAESAAILKAAEDVLKAAAALVFDTADLEKEAEAAKQAAEKAQAVADEALKQAGENKTAAELADKAAKMAEQAAADAQSKADAAKKSAEEAEAKFNEALQKAEQQKAELDRLMLQAQEAQKKAEETQRLANEAQMQAQAAQKAAEAAQLQSAKELEKTKFAAKRVSVQSIKSTKRGQVTIQWKSVKGAEGYLVKYADNAGFRKAKTVKIKKEGMTKATLKKLKSGKRYYFRVRAFGTLDGEMTYSFIGRRKSIKVK